MAPHVVTGDEAVESPGLGPGFRVGVRLTVPFAIAGFILAASFGVVAQDAGLSAVEAIAMSAAVYGGSAQFAAIAILSQGGTVAAAVAAAGLVNSRFLAMGAALAPSLPGGVLKRAAQGQTIVDVSWVYADRGDGSFDRGVLFGSSALQYVAWVSGTVLGALGGGILGDPERLGLDAIYPAFFAALLIGELRNGRAFGAAALGAAIALALVPFTPPGVPVLVAGAAAFLGLVRRSR